MDTEESLFDISGEIDLSVCADSSWFQDRNKSEIWLRIYTLLGIKKSEIPSKFSNAVHSLNYETPVKIHYGYLGKTDIPNWNHHLVGSEDSAPGILLEQTVNSFPGSTCIFISTPFKIDGERVDPYKVTKALSITSTIIAAHIGKNAIRDIVYDGSVSISNGKFSNLGSTTNLPKPFDGPNLIDFLWQGIEETISVLELAEPNDKRRLEMALEFFERGIAEYDKDIRKSDALIFYWIAIESLCGGTGKIESSLRSHYNLPDRASVQSLLGTKNIRDWRNDLVHEGRTKEFTPDLDRYLQLLFLDVLRHQLSLPAICLAKIFSEHPGVDLSSIGLADRSTPGEKNHISTMHFMPANMNNNETQA